MGTIREAKVLEKELDVAGVNGSRGPMVPYQALMYVRGEWFAVDNMYTY